MMYLFTGTDSDKVRKQAFALVDASRRKAPMAPYIRLAPEEISQESLEGALHTQGLFYDRSLVVLDDPFQIAESSDVVLEQIELLQKSENPVFIIAPKLLPARRKKIETKAAKVFVYDVREKAEGRGFNSGLVTALGAKDGKGLWMELMKAKRAGDPAELVHGLLHFKARDLMEKGSRVWSVKDARALSVTLILLVSEAGRSELSLQDALERFALSLTT
jgi:hypothetical protein